MVADFVITVFEPAANTKGGTGGRGFALNQGIGTRDKVTLGVRSLDTNFVENLLDAHFLPISAQDSFQRTDFSPTGASHGRKNPENPTAAAPAS